MKVQDLLGRNMVEADLPPVSKADVLGLLAAHIGREEKVPLEEVLKVLRERERLGSTGIGEGVAIPHGTLSGLTRPVALVARCREGADFDAIDGKPTFIFFVLLTPDNNLSLQALARVSRMLRRQQFRQALLDAPDADGMYQVILSEDERL